MGGRVVRCSGGGFFFFFILSVGGGRSDSLPAPGYSHHPQRWQAQGQGSASCCQRLAAEPGGKAADQRRRGGLMARPTELRRFFLLLPVPLAKLKPFSPAGTASGVRAWREHGESMERAWR